MLFATVLSQCFLLLKPCKKASCKRQRREMHTLLSGFMCFQVYPVRWGLSSGLHGWMDGCLHNRYLHTTIFKPLVRFSHYRLNLRPWRTNKNNHLNIGWISETEFALLFLFWLLQNECILKWFIMIHQLRCHAACQGAPLHSPSQCISDIVWINSSWLACCALPHLPTSSRLSRCYRPSAQNLSLWVCCYSVMSDGWKDAHCCSLPSIHL